MDTTPPTLTDRIAIPPKPKTRWRVIGKNLMVTPDPPKDPVTEGGIALPETARRPQDNTGTVVGIGDKCELSWVIGDRILFMDYGGCEVTLLGKTYLLLDENTVVGREEIIDGAASSDSPIR